jgi:S1-C subfamily serine protease
MTTSRLTCPKCDTPLRLGTAPAPGTRCRCPQCGNIFTATDPEPLPAVTAAPKKAAPATIPAVKAAPKKTAPAIQKTPTAVRPASGGAADDDAPAGGEPKSGDMKWLLLGGGVLGGGAVLLLLLVVIVGLVIWGLSRGKSSAGDTSQTAQLTDKAPDPGPQLDPNPPRPVDSGDGSLPPQMIDRIKQNTLLIKVVAGSGSEGSGSGFFEAGSGLIVTNAHVVGMLDPQAKRPQKIEVVLNSGLSNSATLAGTLVAVDHMSDLALVSVNLPPGQNPSKLTVGMSKELRETQRVYVCGFPLGERANKNVTINPTNVSSLHRGNDGIVTKVQVNGGMDHGNSGGPVVDSSGTVVGVAFSGYEGTQLKFAIPGESVHALLQGRVNGISVTNEAVSKSGQLAVAVTLTTLDPQKRINRIALDYWVGPENQNVPPSDRQPSPGAGNSARQTAVAAYDPNGNGPGVGVARAEVMLSALPDGNNRLWVQPVVTNGTGKQAWLGGIGYVIDPPVEAKAAMLKAQFRQGEVPVHLTSTARFKVIIPDEDPFSLLQNLDTDLKETTKSLAPGGGAQVQLGVKKFATGISKDNEPVKTKPEYQQAMSRDIGALALDHDIDSQGNLKTKKISYLSQVAPSSRTYLEPVGKQLNQSFDIVSVPLPGNLAQPGQTWKAKRELPTPLLMDDILNTLPIDVTYTFRGVRPYKGKQVAVIDLRADLVLQPRGRRGSAQTSLTGKVTGTVLVDPDTGTVVYGKALTDTTLSARSRDEVRQMTGTLEITLRRGN